MADVKKIVNNVSTLKTKVLERKDPSKNSPEEIRATKKRLKRMQRKLRKENVKIEKRKPKAKKEKKA